MAPDLDSNGSPRGQPRLGWATAHPSVSRVETELGGSGGASPGDMRGGDEPLRGKVISGGMWVGVSRVITMVLQVIGTIVLARLLTPNDFGLYAMTMLFVNFSAVLVHAGLGDSIVQRKDLAKQHLSAAFWMNWLAGATIAAVLVVGAVPIADFFGQPDLASLVRLVSITYVVQLGAVPIALLQRAFRFRAIAFIETSSLALGLVAAIIAAVAGWGAASLAIQVIVTTLWFSISSIGISRWLPQVRPTWHAVTDLWEFSGWVAAGNIVGFWSDNVDTLALGRTQSASEVGFYNRAFNLLGLPLTVFVNGPAVVVIPALASIQGDTARSRRVWLSGVLAVSRIAFPTCVGMSAAANSLILTIWGAGWQPAVPFLQVLALAGVPWAVSNACLWALLGRGRGRPYFVLKFMNSVATTALVAGGLLVGGSMGVAWAMLLRSLLMLPIWIIGSLRDLAISPRDVAWHVRWPLLASLIMGLIVVGVGRALTSVAPPVELVIQVFVGVAVYLGITAVADRDALRRGLGLVRGKIHGSGKGNGA